LADIAVALWIAASASVASAETVSVVPLGMPWHHDDRGSSLGTSWREASYDDGSWSIGDASFGYGLSWVTTDIASVPTAYFRHAFTLTGDPAEFQRMMLGTHSDDGLVAYLNGIEIVRKNMPEGTISYGTWAVEEVEGREHVLFDVSDHTDELRAGTNVIAVEVHQASAASPELGFDAELRLTTDSALVTRGPYLQLSTPTGVTIRWRTDVAIEGKVRYGFSPDALNQSANSSLGTEHAVVLDGLDDDTEYWYSVGTESETLAGGDAEHRFRTHPSGPSATDPVRIWVIGDSGSVSAEARQVVESYEAYAGSTPTDLWLSLGDVAYSEGTDAQFEGGVFNTFRSIVRRQVLWPARGNHDYLYEEQLDFYDQFVLPTNAEAGGVPSGTESYYSIDYRNVHVVSLDTESIDFSGWSSMHDWLVADLAFNDLEWVIVIFHHPPYTRGTHNSDNESDSAGRMGVVRSSILPILDALGADLVLSGHSHAYERSMLIDGHYGISDTFDASMVIDGGDGSVTGDGAYTKPSPGQVAHSGIVYAVAGSSSRRGGGPFDHPVMVTHFQDSGSMVIEVTGNRLDAIFLDRWGNARDDFRIVKAPIVGAPPIPIGEPSVSVWAPAIGATNRIRFTVADGNRVALHLHDVAGRAVRTLVDGSVGPGDHDVTWDGLDSRGRSVSAGVYLISLRDGGRHASARLVYLPR
jgi:hypothetical protein